MPVSYLVDSNPEFRLTAPIIKASLSCVLRDACVTKRVWGGLQALYLDFSVSREPDCA
jgi:hypothetical protein